MSKLSPRPPYLTLAAPIRHEVDPIKGSRFIADGRPISDDLSAQGVIDELRGEMPDASHHCWAYALYADKKIKSSDDGEPGGSAGRPILAQITGHGVFDVIIVVTRYFGGTKLGVGGLVRAYGGAAGKLLDAASLRTVTPSLPLRIDYSYAETSRVEAALLELGLEPAESAYGERIESLLWIPDAEWQRARDTLYDMTSGRVRFVEKPGRP